MTDDKTLADINHDAWHRHGGTEGFPAIPLSSRAPEYQEAWRAATAAVVDECINAIGLVFCKAEDISSIKHHHMYDQYTAALRSLKGETDDA